MPPIKPNIFDSMIATEWKDEAERRKKFFQFPGSRLWHMEVNAREFHIRASEGKADKRNKSKTRSSQHESTAMLLVMAQKGKKRTKLVSRLSTTWDTKVHSDILVTMEQRSQPKRDGFCCRLKLVCRFLLWESDYPFTCSIHLVLKSIDLHVQHQLQQWKGLVSRLRHLKRAEEQIRSGQHESLGSNIQFATSCANEVTKNKKKTEEEVASDAGGIVCHPLRGSEAAVLPAVKEWDCVCTCLTGMRAKKLINCAPL